MVEIFLKYSNVPKMSKVFNLYDLFILQVIESKLSWGMVLYGEEEEEMMANR